MMTPILHLNGSGAEALASGYERAAAALTTAIAALEDARPNARDYYPRGANAYEIARREHQTRVGAISDVRAEIHALYEDLTEQIDARNAQKAGR